MQPRRAGTIWSNEDVALAQATKQAKPGAVHALKQTKQSSQSVGQLGKRKDNAADSSDDEDDYQELPSGNGTAAQTDDSDSDAEDAEAAGQDAAVLDEGLSDLDYLKSRMKSHVDTQQEVDDRSSSQTSSLTDTHGQAAENVSAELREGDQAEVAEEEARQQSRRELHAQAGPMDSGMADAANEGEHVVHACSALQCKSFVWVSLSCSALSEAMPLPCRERVHSQVMECSRVNSRCPSGRLDAA